MDLNESESLLAMEDAAKLANEPAEPPKLKRGGSKMKSLSIQMSKDTKSTPSFEATHKYEWSKRESTFIESAEAEGNPRDILNARITELETQLKEVEERYGVLSSEVRVSRDLYEREREDCEDVVLVARLNVEQAVSEVLQKQEWKRQLSQRILNLEADLQKEDEEGTNLLAKEEERLTRSVVLLKTKLLILEGQRFERDNLLAKINAASEEMAAKDKYYEGALAEARQQMMAKYENLYHVLSNQMQAVSSDVVHLTRAQQVAALKERQQSILDTQARYKRAAQLMFRLHDRNKGLREKLSALRRDLYATTSLADALLQEALFAKQDLISFVEQYEARRKEHESERKDLVTPEIRPEFLSQIKEMEARVFEKKDHLTELEEILMDQKLYKKILDQEESRRAFLQDKMFSMSQVAELVLGRDFTQEPTKEAKDQTDRSDFLEKMSTILLESADDQSEKMNLGIDPMKQSFYSKGVLGLIPQDSQVRSRRSSIRSINPEVTPREMLDAMESRSESVTSIQGSTRSGDQ